MSKIFVVYIVPAFIETVAAKFCNISPIFSPPPDTEHIAYWCEPVRQIYAFP